MGKCIGKLQSLSSISDTWSMPAKSKIYLLGETVNLQVSASQLPSIFTKLYISSCFATPYHSSASPLKYALVDNSGYVLEMDVGLHYVSSFCHGLTYVGGVPWVGILRCMTGSRKEPGSSQFVSSQDDQSVRFSFSAFQFTSDPNSQVGPSVLKNV